MKHYKLDLNKFGTFIAGVAVVCGLFAEYIYVLLQIATPM